jgi:hypothetical protein
LLLVPPPRYWKPPQNKKGPAGRAAKRGGKIQLLFERNHLQQEEHESGTAAEAGKEKVKLEAAR